MGRLDYLIMVDPFGQCSLTIITIVQLQKEGLIWDRLNPYEIELVVPTITYSIHFIFSFLLLRGALRGHNTGTAFVPIRLKEVLQQVSGY